MNDEVGLLPNPASSTGDTRGSRRQLYTELMSGEKVWTSESPRRKNDPLDPAVVRAICQIWASHNSGQSWAEIGKERSMGGEVEIAFNELLDQGLEAGQEELWSVYDAYNFHYPKCDDCDGPRPEVIIGTRAPG